MSSNGTVRYSDPELAEFQEIILSKLDQAKEQLQTMQEQILDITENSGDEHGGDWMDDSSINNEVEMLNTMAIRQRKYIKDLENALIRIRNKTYGICVVTGDLIDKRRLLAVPTTTKSLTAKNEERRIAEEKIVMGPTKTPYVKKEQQKQAEPKIITKVIKKSGGSPKPATPKIEEDDDLDLDAEFSGSFGLEIDDDLPAKDIEFEPIPDDESELDDLSTDSDLDYDDDMEDMEEDGEEDEDEDF